jgi:Tol biopolymer transport system component
VLLGFLLLICSGSAAAQYFGRNKPKYKTYDFNVLQSPNFEIYHYLKDDTSARNLAYLHEKWYQKHQTVLKDTFNFRNPVIFYNHHADFQQTTAIDGSIGIGTGGVTEGLKNRMIMPFLETNRQTDHVIGHELVHAFQYHMLRTGDSTKLNSIQNLPLWMVEGMAEYLSTGRMDAHTAMWMRDALLSNDFPTLKDLTSNPRYFPYRYGQAFWAFVTGIWGDKIIRPLFLATAKYGYEAALDSVLGKSAEQLSTMWKNHLQNYYQPFMADTSEVVGQKFFSVENAGELNISPVYSPNGKYMAFISEKNLLTIDIFLVDVKSGRIIRKLSGAMNQSHIDDFNYVESVGTFSPDSRYFAYTVFTKGRNALVVVDVQNGKTVREITIPTLEAFNYPTWSPDGRSIVVSGLVEGKSDLYLYDYRSGLVERLTNDWYSDIHPSFSPDGNYIVFSSDRGKDIDIESLTYGSFRICLLEVQSHKVEVLDIFPGADNLNPQYSADNHMIYFLSNADGFRDLYEYSTVNGDVFRLTKYFTGISGITTFSPALSVARDNGLLAYSLYRDGKYTIYRADPADFGFVREKVDPTKVNFRAGILPPEHSIPVGEWVTLANKNHGNKYFIADTTLRTIPYRPKFRLDYIGNTTVGIAAGRFGTGLAGGVNTLFSDILGNQQLFGALALNGEIYDLGGQLAYINQKSKVNWGVTFSHIPYQSAGLSYLRDTVAVRDTTLPVLNQALDLLRTFETGIGVFSYLPLSQTRRIEVGTSLARYYYRLDRISNYYYQGYLVGEKRERLSTPSGYTISQVNLAYVGDNSVFGTVGPLHGRRYRFGVEQYFGAVNFRSLLADYRHYFWFKPLSIGFRMYHYGRYGRDAESGALPPLFLGFPTLVRGYDSQSFYQKQTIETGGFSINQLSGSRMMVANAELRIPFTGPERLSLFKLNFLPTELAVFADGGIAWDSRGLVANGEVSNVTMRRIPVFSTGLSLRVNVLGYMVIEPYYAIPLQRGFTGGVFGVNFAPGW